MTITTLHTGFCLDGSYPTPVGAGRTTAASTQGNWSAAFVSFRRVKDVRPN